MIEGSRPYPEMKPSGLPWLGDVPEHWDVRRNGRLFGARRETGFPDLPILEVSIRSGVRVRDFDNGGRKQEMADRSKYQRAVRGDIAYNMMRMWQGAVGMTPTDGLVSPAYVVARPFPETEASYYAYLFRTAAYMREIDVFSRGIVPDRNRLYWESFKQMPSVYPPLDEQRLIVRFLDWHGAQSAKLIRAKKKVIALLNEQKQEIKLQTADEQGADSGKYEVRIGEIIYSKIRPALRKAAIAPRNCLCSADMYPITPNTKEIMTQFLLFIMLSNNFTRYSIDCSMRVAMPKINRDALADCWISYPSLEEQAAILSAMTHETSGIDGPINGARQEIALLNEFRARLIADILTGKLDVRAAGAVLPEVSERELVEDLAADDDLDEPIDDPESEEVTA
jgi:restriction endonuclease S subunit